MRHLDKASRYFLGASQTRTSSWPAEWHAIDLDPELKPVQWGSEIAGETAVAAARLPPTCKEALAHAVVVCAGGDPRYFAPGWGPLCVCWGWLCLGAVLGACAVLLILLAHQVGRRPAESPACELEI